MYYQNSIEILIEFSIGTKYRCQYNLHSLGLRASVDGVARSGKGDSELDGQSICGLQYDVWIMLQRGYHATYPSTFFYISVRTVLYCALFMRRQNVAVAKVQ